MTACPSSAAPHRLGLEPVGRPIVVPAEQRTERPDEPHVPVQVVEDQRNRLLAVRHVLACGLVELREERRDQLVDHQIAHLGRERYVAIRRRPVLLAADDNGDAEGDGECRDSSSQDRYEETKIADLAQLAQRRRGQRVHIGHQVVDDPVQPLAVAVSPR